jgi:muramoyltetrapeptide carboxypeptidase
LRRIHTFEVQKYESLEQYLLWPTIAQGDTIAIISTARGITRDAIDDACSIIQSRGYQTWIGSTIGKFHHQFAGDDDFRAQELNQVLANPLFKAVLLARGGYGTMRTLTHADQSLLVHTNKLIIGYSDATVLHAWLNTMHRIPTLHASMPVNFKDNTPAALDTLFASASGQHATVDIPPHPFNKKGKVTAPITGGNLSLLYSMNGTSFDWQGNGWILFLEEVDEYLYHIDRMMTTLRLADKLTGLIGVIVGGLTDMHDNSIPFGESAEEIIHRNLAGLDVPVCFGFPSGHITDNQALPFGIPAQLEVSDTGTRLSFPHY